VASQDVLVRLRAVGARAFQRDMDTSAKSVEGVADAGEKTGKRTAKSFGKWAAGSAAVAGGTKVMKDSITNAVDLGESISAANVVFKDGGKQINQWAATSTKRTMMSRNAALQAATTFGSQLKNAYGMSGKEAATTSSKMVTLAADMASLRNTSPQQAVEALGSALKGENDPIEAYGVSINDTMLKQEALRQGLYKGKGPLTDQAKRAATLGLIWKQTKDAQGDAVRTQDSLANRAKVAKAQYENLTTTLGTKLLPILTWMADHLTPIAVAVGILTAAWLAYRTAVMISTLATMGLNTAMLPWLLIPALIIAIGAALVIMYQKVGWFHKAVDAVWNFIKTNWPLLLAILTGPIGAAVLLIVKNFDKIKAAASAVWDFVKSLPSKIAGLASGFAQAGANIAKAIGRGITGAFKGAVGLASDIGRAIADWLNAHTPLGDKISLPGPLPDFTLPALATGGIMPWTGTALVGEQGPELVNLPGGAHVTPLPALGGAMTANLYLDRRLVATAVAQRDADVRARR